MTSTGKRLTGLQKQVLALYRSCLRGARAKPPAARTALYAYARDEFHKHQHVSHSAIQLIEHLMRRGHKQLELLSKKEAQGIHVK